MVLKRACFALRSHPTKTPTKHFSGLTSLLEVGLAKEPPTINTKLRGNVKATLSDQGCKNL